MKETILNSPDSFGPLLVLCKKHFKAVKVIENMDSNLARKSQNFHKLIEFKNRGILFTIKWNYLCSTITQGKFDKKAAFHYTFTRCRLDTCYPIEPKNNNNVMFWSVELLGEYSENVNEIGVFRIPVSIS